MIWVSTFLFTHILYDISIINLIYKANKHSTDQSIPKIHIKMKTSLYLSPWIRKSIIIISFQLMLRIVWRIPWLYLQNLEFLKTEGIFTDCVRFFEDYSSITLFHLYWRPSSASLRLLLLQNIFPRSFRPFIFQIFTRRAYHTPIFFRVLTISTESCDRFALYIAKGWVVEHWVIGKSLRILVS